MTTEYCEQFNAILINFLCIVLVFYYFVGRGIPKAAAGCPVRLVENQLPCGFAAADWDDAESAPVLTRVSNFGTDPFHTDEGRQEASRHFPGALGDITLLLDCIFNNNPGPFVDVLQ